MALEARKGRARERLRPAWYTCSAAPPQRPAIVTGSQGGEDMRAPCWLFATASVLGVATAAANPVKSLYTTVELKSCQPLKRHRDGDAWRCEGLPGYPVYVAQGELRP